MKNLTPTPASLTASTNYQLNLLTGICFLLMLMLLGSCKPSCTCAKNVGCERLTAINLKGDTLLTQIYCSQTNYFTDQALADSVAAFRSRYRIEGIKIITVDTIGNYEQIKINSKDEEYYLNNGYGCSCKF